MAKKVLAILLAATFILSGLAGCGDKNNGTNNGGTITTPDGGSTGIFSETIRIPEQPLPFVMQQGVTALAVQQYITARLYLDALIEFDMNTNTIQEFAELYDGTIEQFELAEAYAAQAASVADLAQNCIDSGIKLSNVSYSPEQGGGAVTLLNNRSGFGNPFILTAYAAEPPQRTPDEIRAWARDIEAMAIRNACVRAGIRLVCGNAADGTSRPGTSKQPDGYGGHERRNLGLEKERRR